MNITCNKELLDYINETDILVDACDNYSERRTLQNTRETDLMNFLAEKYFYTRDFPRPVYFKTHVARYATKNSIPKYAEYNGFSNYQYFYIPGIGNVPRYEDVIKKIGKRFAIFRDDSCTFSVYAKELDVVITFAFCAVEDKYKVQSARIYFRKGTTVFKGDTIESTYKPYELGCFYKSRFIGQTPIFHGPYGEDESLSRAFKKMYGSCIVNIKANNFIRIQDDYEAFMKAGSPKKTAGKKQKHIDELCDIKLPKVDVKGYIRENNIRVNLMSSFTSISKVKEGVSVLRWSIYDQVNDQCVDTLRIYCEKNTYTSCKRNENGDYVIYPVTNLNLENFKSDYMFSIKKEDVEGTSFSYYYNIINEMDENSKSLALLAFIRNPMLEQMAKIGFSSYIGKTVKYVDRNRKLENEIYSAFKPNTKEKNIYKYLGLNNYQTKLIVDAYNSNEYSRDMVRNMKSKIFLMDDLSSVDNDTFDKILDFCKSFSDNYRYNCLERICKELKERNEKLYRNFISNILPKLKDPENCYRTGQNINIYFDYIEMVRRIDGFDDFKLNFDSIEHLNAMHDIATSLYEIKRYEIDAKNFAKNVAKMKEYEYSPKGSKFVVIAPEQPLDIAKEGIELHHCVKSYIPRIANGYTNIIFIRKEEDKGTPFFTVEISNEKSIEQVHGFGNRNADTEEGLTEFVEKWAKSKKLKVNGINKVR